MTQDEADQLNKEAMDDTAFDMAVNPRDYQGERWLAEAIDSAAESLSYGLCWAGFWIGCGLCFGRLLA